MHIHMPISCKFSGYRFIYFIYMCKYRLRNVGRIHAIPHKNYQIIHKHHTNMRQTKSKTQSFRSTLKLAPQVSSTERKLVPPVVVVFKAFPVALTEPLGRLAGRGLWNVYGPTEATIWATTFALGGLGSLD